MAKKITQTALWAIGSVTSVLGLFLLWQIQKIIAAITFGVLDVSSAPNAPGGGWVTMLPLLTSTAITNFGGMASFYMGTFCLFAIGLIITFRLYSAKRYIASPLVALFILAVGFPLLHAQFSIAGSRTQFPPGASLLTYRELTDSSDQPTWFAVDGQNAFCNSRILQGADPKTLTLISQEHYAKDRHHVYYNCDVIQGADPATFSLIDSVYARDAKNVYFYNALVRRVDPATFTTSDRITRDKNHVIVGGQILPDADPQTYTLLPGVGYAKDKKHVFYLDNEAPILGADPATFITTQKPGETPPSCGGNCNFDARDQNHLYWRGGIVKLQP